MKKILVAYDGTESADRPLTRLSTWQRHSTPQLASLAWSPSIPGRPPIDPWDDPAVHAEQLANAQRILRDAGVEPQLHKEGGDPARVIEQIAQADGYDVIVIGSRGLGSLARALQGSVSEHVATHAKSTVVIAR